LFPAIKAGREVANVTITPEPAHLPKCPIDPADYEQLYAFNGGVDDYLEDFTRWEEIRIKPGLTEDDVYRLLPCAGDFEYGGYLTKSRIRFLKCGPNRANMPMSKACTFHSHPTDMAAADVPSASDVLQFLNFRHLRAITVGASRLWVWDKTKATIPTVKLLGAWAEANTVRDVERQLTFPTDDN